LINLQKLYLSNNQIKKIKKYKWIDKFRSIIFTIDNNKTKKIENLDKLINLKILSLSCYKIKKIENLNNLINWESLSLDQSKKTNRIFNKFSKFEKIVLTS